MCCGSESHHRWHGHGHHAGGHCGCRGHVTVHVPVPVGHCCCCDSPSKEDQAGRLEQYLAELRQEVQAAEEKLAALQEQEEE